MKLKSKSIVIFVAILNCQNIFGQTNNNKIESINKPIDIYMKNMMNQLGIVGIGAGIIIDKKVVWTKGYGFADRENKIAFTPKTIMNIGSISKTFTGVCLMKAVEEKNVTLDEDINNYLPFKIVNPNFPKDKITLRDLATHTSGLADRYPFYTDSTYFYNGNKPEDLGEFLKNYFIQGGKHYSKDNFLNARSGTFREYSNIGAALVGYIIELKTGQKLSSYAKKYIFKPLRMINSGWSLNEINIKDHTKLYKKQGDTIIQIPLYEGTTYPDGGVRTSVNELSKFFVSLLNQGRYKNSMILNKDITAEMLRFQYTESNKPSNVKLDKLNSGIFWATKMNATRIGHNGSDPGIRTFMLSNLDKEIGIIIFFNTSLSDEEEIKFFNIYEELYRYALKLKIEKTAIN